MRCWWRTGEGMGRSCGAAAAQPSWHALLTSAAGARASCAARWRALQLSHLPLKHCMMMCMSCLELDTELS